MTDTETLAKGARKPYGDVPYADPGYLDADGNQVSQSGNTPVARYPIDAKHVQAAWSYINQARNAGQYTAAQLASIKSKIKAAMGKFGHAVSDGQSAADRAAFELRRRRRRSIVAGERERRGLALATGGVEVRAAPDGTGGTKFVFEGYASVFDQPFPMWDRWGEEYTEIVMPGAFTETLARQDLDVPFLIGHNDAGIPLARTRAGTMHLEQDSTGLHVWAEMDGGRSDVRNLASAVDRGEMDEMSIGFVTRDQEWDDEFTHRSLLALDMHRGDVSAVALGASPATAGSSMTPVPAEALAQQAPGETATAEDPDGEERLTKGTRKRLPMVLSMLDTAVATFKGADRSQFDQQTNQAIDLVGSADIHVNHVVDDEGLPNSRRGTYAGDNPDHEERGNPVDQNLGDTSDYVVGGKGPVRCQNPQCPVAGGCVNPPGSLYCAMCGQKLPAAPAGSKFAGDKTVVLDPQTGLISEEQPRSMTSLAADTADLERRRRDLALLATNCR